MSHEGIDKLADLFPHCFFRRSHLRRPLKLGIHEDIIAQHPELDRTLIGRGLNAYTHSTTYWLTLTAGTPRINLDGNLAGEVTLKEEEHAKQKIAKATRRAAANAIEDCKAAGQPAAKPAGRAGQKDPIPETKFQQPEPAEPPLGLACLKAAAQARRARLVAPKLSRLCGRLTNLKRATGRTLFDLAALAQLVDPPGSHQSCPYSKL